MVRKNVIDFKEKFFLNFKCVEDDDVFNCPIILKLKHDNFYIFKMYIFEIFVPYDLQNNIPTVKVLKGIEKSTDGFHHFNNDGTLCLEVPFIQNIFLKKNNYSIIKWFERFVYSFLIQYEYYCDYGKMLFGDRAHFDEGIKSAIIEYLEVKEGFINIFFKTLIKCDEGSLLPKVIKKWCSCSDERINEFINSFGTLKKYINYWRIINE